MAVGLDLFQRLPAVGLVRLPAVGPVLVAASVPVRAPVLGRLAEGRRQAGLGPLG